MYRWYADSVVCYVHLPDVQVTRNLKQTLDAFEGSEWFARGWTLQELLAPSHVIVFDKIWTSIGTREELAAEISGASGILQSLVSSFHRTSTGTTSATEKFSWISTRKTSRVEDLAYCLMGLFDINMPLLYGEGNKAWRRLQLEILRSTNDESVFLWDVPLAWPWTPQLSSPTSGLLAERRTHFGPGLYLRYKSQQFSQHRKVSAVSRPPYTITNQGLEFRVPKRLASRQEFYLPLNYRYFKDNVFEGVYAILVRRMESQEDIWQRYFPSPMPATLPKLPRVEYDKTCGPSRGLFVAPESWLWSRTELGEMETEVIYIKL